jgi:Zn2+/Cd2+-exporting ATPase
MHSASVALMNNDLRRIPFLVALARRTHRIMVWNMAIGLVFIFGGLALSASGRIAPLAAALLHSAGTLIVVFNSARLVRAGETQG